METEVVVESKATPEQKIAAEKMGWIPDTRFKGDPEKFVDADVFLERGEQVLPIVTAQNKRLRADVERLGTENRQLAAAVTASQKAINEIEARHTVETQKAVERARVEVKAQLAKASEAGDHEAVAELTDQLVDLKKAEEDAKAAKVEAKVETKSAEYVPSAVQKAWLEENPWYGVNKRHTALYLGIANEIAEVNKGLTESELYKLTDAEFAKETKKPAAEEETRGADKTESGRHGTDGGARSGKGFASLPKDARDACHADTKKFVGAGKMFKTVAEWETHFTTLYKNME